jgi:hypothetical protein
MSRQTTRRRNAKIEVSPRTLLLAGLGAAVLARKQARRSFDSAAANADQLRDRAEAAACEAGRQVARLRTQAEAFAERAQAEFEARFIAGKPAKAKARRTQRPAAPRSRRKRA